MTSKRNRKGSLRKHHYPGPGQSTKKPKKQACSSQLQENPRSVTRKQRKLENCTGRLVYEHNYDKSLKVTQIGNNSGQTVGAENITNQFNIHTCGDEKCKICIGEHIYKWNILRQKLGLTFNYELAGILLQRYYETRELYEDSTLQNVTTPMILQIKQEPLDVDNSSYSFITSEEHLETQYRSCEKNNHTDAHEDNRRELDTTNHHHVPSSVHEYPVNRHGEKEVTDTENCSNTWQLQRSIDMAEVPCGINESQTHVHKELGRSTTSDKSFSASIQSGQGSENKEMFNTNFFVCNIKKEVIDKEENEDFSPMIVNMSFPKPSINVKEEPCDDNKSPMHVHEEREKVRNTSDNDFQTSSLPLIQSGQVLGSDERCSTNSYIISSPGQRPCEPLTSLGVRRRTRPMTAVSRRRRR